MALCPNKNTPFYKKLEETFGSIDGWRIAHRTMKPTFEKWYGKGKKDKYGNPVIVNNTFVNENKEVASISKALYRTEEERELWKEGEQSNWESPLTGIPSKLTKSQWVHTRTEEFLDWFGDWINTKPDNRDTIYKETGEPKVFTREGKKVFLKNTEVTNYQEIKAAESNNGEFPTGKAALYDKKLDFKKAEHRKHIEDQATRLKNIFYTHGIDVGIIYDNTLPKNAEVTYHGGGKATITVNPNRVYKDTIPHEFSHLYIDLLGYDNPVIQRAIKQLKKEQPEEWKTIREIYSDKTLEQQEKELLVVMMASNAAEVGENDRTTSKWMYNLNRIWRAIAGIFGKERDFAKELYLDMVYDKFAGTKKGNLQKGTQDSRLLKIQEDNKGIFLDSTTEEPVYRNKEDGSKSYYRGTEFTNGKKREGEETIPGLSPKVLSGNKSWAEWTADKYFKDKNKDTDTIPLEEKQEDGSIKLRNVSYQDILNELEINGNTRRERGNITHLIMQRETMKHNGDNGDNVDKINKEIEERAAEKPGKQNEIVLSKLNWLVSNIQSIFQSIGLNIFQTGIDPSDTDNMEAEVVLHSDSLKVATTADTIIEHSDGTLSMLDWKSGANFLNDAYETAKLLKYSDSSNDMYDTKLGRAMMEMTLRAIILKEQQKNAKFRDIKVVHLNRIEGAREFYVDLKQTLPIFKEFLKNERPAEYAALITSNPNIFNHKEYKEPKLDNKKLYDKAGYGRDQILNELKNDLFTLSTKKKKTLEDRDTIETLTKEIMVMEGEHGIDINVAHYEDVSSLGRWLANKYSKNNPLIRKFFANHYNPAREKLNQERQRLHKEHAEVLVPVLKEYLDEKRIKYDLKNIGTDYQKGMSYLLGVIGYASGAGTLGALVGTQIGSYAGQMYKRKVNTEELYGFLYKNKEGVEERGKYLATDTSKMTEAQKKYHKFFRDTIQEQYQKATGRDIYVPSLGTTKPFWEIAGSTKELPEDFLPRIPMDKSEMYERKSGYGEKAKQVWKDIEYSWRKHIVSTNEKAKYDDIMMGSKLRYMGSAPVISSEYHSLNGELIFNTFIDHLLTKQHMDEVYAVGQGVITLMEGHPNGEEHFKQAIGFMKDQLEQNVLNKSRKEEEDRWKYKIPKFTFTRQDGIKVIPNEYMYVDISTFANSLRGFTSMISMWLKFWAGTANAALILMLSVKTATAGSIAKMKGVDSDDIDFTLSDLVSAEKEILKYWVDVARGKANQNKLHLFHKKYDYLPKNYDYKVEEQETYTGKLKLFNTGALYNFHTIPEEWGTHILMVAQLKSMKLPDGKTSMWDAYEVKDGELVWKGGERFKVKRGDGSINVITDLTPEEVNKLKRNTARIHGGYRREERTALEMTTVGKWLLQFKKYLPAIFENAINDRYADESLGSYKKIEGEDFYEWVPRMHEGRINTFAKYASSYLSKGSYAPMYHPTKGKLTAEDRQNIYSVKLSIAFWIAITFSMAMAFDDDDDKNPIKMKLKHLAQNATQDINPMDWANALKTPTVVISRMYDLASNIMDFFIEGVFQGRRVQSGPNKGRIYKSYQVEKSLPLFNSSIERDNYLEALSQQAQ